MCLSFLASRLVGLVILPSIDSRGGVGWRWGGGQATSFHFFIGKWRDGGGLACVEAHASNDALEELAHAIQSAGAALRRMGFALFHSVGR